jgi:uncharacterized membrane protein (UPF0136 family)
MLTITIALAASIIQIIGHIVYNRELESKPNLTSLTIWGITSLIDTLNYIDLTGDWQKNLLAITCALSCLVTWLLLLFRGRFSIPRAKEYISLMLSAAALVLWKQFSLLRESSALLQVDNVISFIPIIASTWHDPKSERPHAWTWWTVSYGLGTLVVVLRMNDWVELLYPLSCFILHLLVAVFALGKHKKTIS